MSAFDITLILASIGALMFVILACFGALLLIIVNPYGLWSLLYRAWERVFQRSKP